jgi:hypothetical protein
MVVELDRPYEIYEWEDGKTERWTILRWELGQLEIQLRSREGTKDIDVLRIHVPPEDKEHEPYYWDLTSARLTRQLRGILDRTTALPVTLEITAIGRAPRTHFSVTPVPQRPG